MDSFSDDHKQLEMWQKATNLLLVLPCPKVVGNEQSMKGKANKDLDSLQKRIWVTPVSKYSRLAKVKMIQESAVQSEEDLDKRHECQLRPQDQLQQQGFQLSSLFCYIVFCRDFQQRPTTLKDCNRLNLMVSLVDNSNTSARQHQISPMAHFTFP